MKTYNLTREMVGDALVEYIAKWIEGKLFFPYKIITTKGIELSEEIDIKLELVPKGTLQKDAQHNIGGN